MDVAGAVRSFIVEYFLFGDDENLNDHTSFIEEAIVDSTGILELVAFVEETFSIRVEDEELIPENLDSISSVERYVSSKMKG
ncbi:MAG: acyl carrier protein [Deltaproteobacteria bacterium]|nr:acyl carrier protein [Deltaproteobacteria bacterium]MBW2113168.1 acyl carrier protein [Deltaproteobacteria bacterium]MBW2355122.1 acyl carrier protein [Deltaproteobacteria bacterium]HDZ24169.1 acyl carrier protein [Desulfobacteraceae bacterium]